MEIVGLGTQVLECGRVRKLIDQYGEAFLKQVFTEREVQFCNGRRQTTEQFAAVWAAKEAIFRALGTTWKRGTSWTDVEVVCDGGLPIRVVLSGPTRELMAARGVTRFLLTMAFCRDFATATGIALRVPTPHTVEDTAIDD